MLLFLIGRMLLYHVNLIAYPYPVEYREGADLLLTTNFARGIDPYALAVQPQDANAYGFFSNLLAAPLVALWGPSFAFGRALSTLATLGACLLLAVVLRRMGVPRLWCVAAAVLFDASMIADTLSLAARPDGVGLLLFLASLCLPWLDGYSPRSLVISGIAAVLAFHTKLYFVFGAAYLALFLFLFISKRRAILYAAGVALALLVSVWLINQRADLYLSNAVYAHFGFTDDDLGWAIEQFVRFVRFYGPLIGLALVALALGGWQARHHWPMRLRARLRLNLTGVSRPLIEQADSPLALFALCGALSAAILYLKMGRHHGATDTYYLQLIGPFVVVVLIALLARHVRPLLSVGLIAVVLLTGQAQIAAYAGGAPDSSAWQQLTALMADRYNVMAAPPLAGLLLQSGRPVYDSGSTEYFDTGYDAQYNVKKLFRAYQATLRAAVQQRAFDLIVTSNLRSRLFNAKDVTSGYRHLTRIDVSLPYVGQLSHLDLWVPQVH